MNKRNKIISDNLALDTYRKLNYACACEDCTHFDALTETCTFGYPTTDHLKRNQLNQIETSGTIAFCRAIEID